MGQTIIRNAQLVNEGKIQVQDILFRDQRIERIDPSITIAGNALEIDAAGKFLIPGLIDDQVHFREPGLTHKACIETEARAAVSGGVTSFMEMPNVVPPTLDMERLEEKFTIAKNTSLGNYSFFMGISNENAEAALKVNQHKKDVCGYKIFMGSSTGNMLVDNIVTLERIFTDSELLIATHCEKEQVVRNNLERLKQEGVVFDHARYHPVIRDVEACFESSITAIQLAKKHNTRLHILHISTEKELQLFTNLFPLADKRITAEVCVHHLYFTADDYDRFGNLIKCNPAIKDAHHKEALWKALLDDRLDILATDHAPHTWDEKQKPYMEAPAGIPLVQHSLLMLLEAMKEGRISFEKIVEKACHAPAICFEVKERGYLREGYFADAVLVDLNQSTTVTKENILHRCGWSPFEGHTFPAAIEKTFVNGNLVFDGGQQVSDQKGLRLQFDRD
jgi:dihydroorotase